MMSIHYFYYMLQYDVPTHSFLKLLKNDAHIDSSNNIMTVTYKRFQSLSEQHLLCWRITLLQMDEDI